ncbi:MAG: chemotaxis protein CheW [Deltaproteobacteria bacterium]|nr:chemotaxis protein CheW [Deltaproteobacteria bacterium]MBN2673990.1 chemotaxis protein CheW [Deltaproteobacteria bacterium]
MADMETGWVLFTLEKQQFGMPIKNLLQMVVLENVTTQATAPAVVRGLIKLRDRVVPVVDTRQCLGMETKLTQMLEFVDMMNSRKQDHIRWLDELFASVEENRAFTLARDPHQCAFGKWYNEFATDNAIFAMHLTKFDQPHRRIHLIADQVENLIVHNRTDEAKRLIQQTRDGDLHTMIELFDGVEGVLKDAEKEIVLVMNMKDRLLGFIVDDVYTVRDIANESVQMVDNIDMIQIDGVTRVANVDGITSILLQPEEIFHGATV